jgi:hypothetical protein
MVAKPQKRHNNKPVILGLATNGIAGLFFGRIERWKEKTV